MRPGVTDGPYFLAMGYALHVPDQLAQRWLGGALLGTSRPRTFKGRPILCQVGEKSIGVPIPVSLTMTLLDFFDSSPRLELKVMVPKEPKMSVTYFGLKMEPPSMALSHQINIRLEPQTIRSLRWRNFATGELQLPANAIKEGNLLTVFESAAQKPIVHGASFSRHLDIRRRTGVVSSYQLST